MEEYRISPTALENLEAAFKSGDPARQLQALREAEGGRGYRLLYLVEPLTTSDVPEVQAKAKAVRERIREQTALFGGGRLPRLELPPAELDSAEARRTAGQLWWAWIAGGFMAVTALIVREHTGLTFLPLLVATLMTGVIMAVALKLRSQASGAGYLLIEEESKEVILELPSHDKGFNRARLSFSLLRGLRLCRRSLPGEEGDPSALTWEVWLEAPGETRFLLARAPQQEQAEKLLLGLRRSLPLPILPES